MNSLLDQPREDMLARMYDFDTSVFILKAGPFSSEFKAFLKYQWAVECGPVFSGEGNSIMPLRRAMQFFDPEGPIYRYSLEQFALKESTERMKNMSISSLQQ